MDFGFSGKTIIVTGGVSNIGRAITLAFASEGANVVIADIDEKNMKVVSDIANAKGKGGRTVPIKTDVTKLNEVENMFKKALGEFKAVDILVNNVGWTEPKFFLDTTPELWQRLIEINFISALNCLKVVLPHMIERKQGAIVSISSDGGRMGEVRDAVYSGLKSGIITLSKSIAREVGSYGIRANTICPGATVPASDEVGEFSMAKRGIPSPEIQEKMTKGYPLRKLGKPQDIAAAVLFLASDITAGDITGQTLSVSGGYTMI